MNDTSNNKSRPLVKRVISGALFFSDVIMMIFSFMFAFFTIKILKNTLFTEIYNKPLPEYAHINDLVFMWICPIVLFLFFTKGHYTQRIPWWNQVQSILSICLLAFVIDGFVHFALDTSFSRLLVGFSWAYAFVLILIGRQLVYILLRGKGLWRISTTVIGDMGTVTDILFAFSTDHYTGYKVQTVALRDENTQEFITEFLPEKYKNINIIYDDIDYHHYIENNLDQFFVISLESFRGTERDALIKLLTERKALYAAVPAISRMSLIEMEPRHFFGYDIMLLHAKNTLFSPLGRIVKRSMDIVLASLALLCLFPIMLSVMGFLKLEGQGGSLFYGGYRVGRYGKKFKCWKFRSMEPDSDHLLHDLLDNDPDAKAEWDIFKKLKRPDPRVTTKTARIIRKLSIDELPQLWNVLKGDMSLVGPRPILQSEIDLFGDHIHQYYQTRPGITDLWQVSGRNNTSFKRRTYWDSWYVRNWSIWGDIVIMIKTVRAVLGSAGAH